MTKNTAYYKAAFAKSEAASPYSKINPHTKGHGMHNPSMKMSHDSAMETHDPTHMKMGHKKVESFGKGKKSPPDPGTGLTKKYGTHAKMATHLQHSMHKGQSDPDHKMHNHHPNSPNHPDKQQKFKIDGKEVSREEFDR